ncbi:class I SAM-dependent methyltransferase [Caballeronia sp. LZ035]|uniref:class I SAM-dependent methyltransferase n=1 Tax=Caballeronia sp. LZ035 TaxID=3038568 RepID=UPI002865ADAA|nr:class I SAM-dependent methyltransferase [Caballeronia sp. LZ035]MDR5756314.1 class I SAM-dependent methyltransferase [Caballeronia sp. LZ035]
MNGYLRSVAKSIALNAPPIKKLIDSKSALLLERDAAAADRDRSRIERDEATAECRRIEVQRNTLATERDELLVYLQAANDKRDELLAYLQAANDERDSLRSSVETLETQEHQTLNRVHADLDRLQRFGEGPPFVPNGHFYSPIPALKEVQRNQQRIFGEWPRELPGIDLREASQLSLLESFLDQYRDLPFGDDETAGFRYRYRNPAYGHSDAIFLNMMLRHVKPARVIEIGSGYSSCMLLDTNEHWFDNSIVCTFIEPYPELLHSLLKEGDTQRVTIIPTGVQDVDLATFGALQANDVLFVDSTHVSKVGSDVNQIIFNVLPSLASGVYVHFHDIFYPFEYPRQWIEEGRAWNEAYMLRAFLQNNSAFEVVMFNTYMQHFHESWFVKNMPLCMKNTGASIWLRKR